MPIAITMPLNYQGIMADWAPMRDKRTKKLRTVDGGYPVLLQEISALLDEARRSAVRSVNTILTAAYWEIGRRIVKFEQGGRKRADYYGEEILDKLVKDLQQRFGRGFGRSNLFQMRAFYLAYSNIIQTPSGQSKSPNLQRLITLFPLSWSHYVRLLSVKNPDARHFYESQALRNGWSIRQLDRQIGSLFFERTILSKKKAAVIKKGAKPKSNDVLTPEEEIKDPYILEFLNLKDEYSENDIEEALILHLEKFLLELGGDFTFVGRQKRLRVGDAWFRVDLIFYHRRLHCLIIIDLKTGEFTHADAGQMHLYLNYAKEHWTHEDENPPVGLILCTKKDAAVAKYALEGLPNKVVASEYKLALPDEQLIAKEIKQTRKLLEARTPKTIG